MPTLRRLENLFRLLLPPASREHVLGDLHEKCKSPREYIVDAVSVLGPVIIGRIRRTTDFQVFLIETFAVYISFSAAAWGLGQKTFLYDRAGFARLAIPATVIAIGLLLCNAYADPEKQSSWKPVLQSAGSISLAFFGQTVLFDTRPGFAVPLGIMLYGSCTSLLLVSALRILFPPIHSSRSKAVFMNSSRFLRIAKLVPAKVRFQEVRQRIGDAQSPSRTKIAIMGTAALLVTSILFSTIWQGVAMKPRFAVFAIVVLIVVYQIRTRD